MNTTSTQTRRANTYAGTCTSCGAHVSAQAGRLGGKINGRWTVLCAIGCTAKTSTAKASTTKAWAPAHRNACESCGGGPAHYATDLSGVGGYACDRCDDDSLSFC